MAREDADDKESVATDHCDRQYPCGLDRRREEAHIDERRDHRPAEKVEHQRSRELRRVAAFAKKASGRPPAVRLLGGREFAARLRQADAHDAKDCENIEDARAEDLARPYVGATRPQQRDERHRELGQTVAGGHDGAAEERARHVEHVGRGDELERRHIPLLEQHVHREDGVEEEEDLDDDETVRLEVEELLLRSALGNLLHG